MDRISDAIEVEHMSATQYELWAAASQLRTFRRATKVLAVSLIVTVAMLMLAFAAWQDANSDAEAGWAMVAALRMRIVDINQCGW